ncbi:MAG: transposase, partial [Actinobacteria bacterium]|nr:transposase [Actinomycetota bacterium]
MLSAPVPVPAAPPDPLDGVARAALLGEVETTVRVVVAGLEPDAAAARRPGPGRPRVLPALALWSGVLVCVLRGATSQRAVWRLLSAKRLWDYPRFAVSDQAVYKRLAEDGTDALEALFAAVGRLLADRLAPWAATDLAPFASEVVALDETTLDQVARTLPALREVPKGADVLLPGKLAAVFDLRRQLFRRVEHLPAPRQNEKVAARDLLAGLAKGALVLADLGYFGFAWFDDLTDRGFWWVSRLRAKTSYTVLHAHYRRGDTLDAIVWLGAHRADRAKHAVRLVQFRHGGALYRYVTNVLDPTVLPPTELA